MSKKIVNAAWTGHAWRLTSAQGMDHAPCNNCYYESRRCAQGWCCPVYRRWAKGYEPREHEERIPDERI